MSDRDYVIAVVCDDCGEVWEPANPINNGKCPKCEPPITGELTPLDRLLDAAMDQPNPTPELQDAVEDFVEAFLEDEAVGTRIAAATLGKIGGLKGGPARAAKLTPERRREIATKAAAARWENKP